MRRCLSLWVYSSQQLTGRELPPSAEHVVQYWREHVLENAGGILNPCVITSPIKTLSPTSAEYYC